MTAKVSLDPEDEFDQVLIEMKRLSGQKGKDYGREDPFQNFYDSSAQLNLTAGHSCEVLIATKQARLRKLLFSGRAAANESERDTLIDRAVYSVIALVLYDRGNYVQEKT